MLRQAINTIKFMRPAVFIMEKVGRRDGNYEAMLDLIKQDLDADYVSMAIDSITPKQHGYPTEQKRVLVAGGRRDQVDATDLQTNFGRLIVAPMPLSHTYWTFLGCRCNGRTVAHA